MTPLKRRFSLIDRNGSERNRLLKGFYVPMRKRRVLSWDAKPEHGVSQPMPPRKAKS